jgi:hypothetical protein
MAKPDQPSYIVPDAPHGFSSDYLAQTMSELNQTMRADLLYRQSRTLHVDEYLAQSGALTSTTSVALLPQFEIYDEVIERVLITGPSSEGLSTAYGRATVTDPTGGATVLSLGVVPAGQYNVNWEVDLEGTVTEADADNMKFQLGATGIGNAIYPGQVGLYPQEQLTYTSDGSSTSKVIANGAASGAGAIYGAAVSLSPAGSTVPFTLQLGDRYWNLALTNTGILEFSTKLLLSRTDKRLLTSIFPGAWTLELMGYADVRNP